MHYLFSQFRLEDESEEDDVQEKKPIKGRTSKKRLSYDKEEDDGDESVQFKVSMFIQILITILRTLNLKSSCVHDCRKSLRRTPISVMAPTKHVEVMCPQSLAANPNRMANRMF